MCAAIVSLSSVASGQTLSLEPVKTGLDLPIGVTHAGDGSRRLFINLQRGRMVVWDGTKILPTPFLDISSLASCCGERGLLGVAFHPRYESNGLFFVNYTDSSGNTVVARYRVSSSDPNRADPATRLVIFTQAQPFSNHNGGQIRFGPDGFLYIAMGDGGSAGDPNNVAQNRNSLLGKMLRIDIDRTAVGKNYAIPPGNPFATGGGAPEIWALGLRNTWAFSFDRQTGDLYMGDVGQDSLEEIDFEPANSGGGKNYGWRIMEGRNCFNPSSNCNQSGLTLPILQYDHALGCSVTGGYVYRGARFPALQGTYLYGDFCSGRVWGAKRNGTTWTSNQLLDTNRNIVAWGEDEAGELYLAHHGDESSANGALYRVVSTASGEITLDNAVAGASDANRRFTGAWCKSSRTGFYGVDSLYSCGAGADSYRWTPNIPAAGRYDVFVRWTNSSTRSASVPVTVAHADGTTSKRFNQQTGGGQWVRHGNYRFLAGTRGYVQTDDSQGQASADAVRLVPAAAPTVATLRVSVSGSGTGRVTSTPPGIDCGSDCSQDYALNTVVSLIATPGPNSQFVEWGGPCSGNGTCTITMADSQFLAATFSAPSIIVDNAAVNVQDSAGGRTFTGKWCNSAGTSYYGTRSLYSCGSGADTYRWTPRIPATAAYDVYVRWSTHVNRSANVAVKVVHAGGTDTSKSLNQTVNGGTWVLLGRYTFNAGSTGYVEVSDASGLANADAVQLVPAF